MAARLNGRLAPASCHGWTDGLMAGVVIDGEVVEFNLGGRYQLLTTAQTLGWIDVAASTDMALTMAGPCL